MRKIFLLLAASTVLFACDNLKSKTNKNDDEEITLKKKKPLNDEEDADKESSDEPLKSKRKTDRDALDEEDTNNDERLTDDSEGDDSGSDGWSALEKRSFMSKCVEGATRSFGTSEAKNYCSCMLEKIERRYPKPLDAARLTQSDMEPLAKDCINQ